jgi:hypothetical protein
MFTLKQITACRAYVRKSKGTRTFESKTAFRFSSLKRRILAETQIMPNESAEDFAALAAAFHQRHPPVDPAERLLIETLVRNERRLHARRTIS